MKTALVLISANSEWKVVREVFPHAACFKTPFGEGFETEMASVHTVLMQGGWGKVSAAASTQYGIQRWQPNWILNLGTCGGFHGRVQRGEIILADETLIYDIYEAMGDPQQAIEHYSCHPVLAQLPEPYPHPANRTRLVSADRDIIPAEIEMLCERFQASAADWESGSIAWVAQRNGVPVLILRGVSDLVSPNGGEAYGKIDVFHSGTHTVMAHLLETLPDWLGWIQKNAPQPA